MTTRWAWAAAMLLGLGGAAPRGGKLGDVRTFMYQFQRIEDASAVEALAASAYDLLIVEPVGTYRSGKNVDMRALATRLRGKRPGRLVVAYLNLAEADNNRAYWESSWKEPSGGRAGRPDFLIGPDPDGWKDTFVVRYWDPRWRDLLLADLRNVLRAGFDGLCLDWTDAYENAALAALARADGVSPAREMIELLSKAQASAVEVNPKALMVLQNPSGLLEEDTRAARLADAVLYEHVWYGGKAEVGWSDERGGDLDDASGDSARRLEIRLARMAAWKKEGKPVLTLDYCLKPEHARQVYERSAALGYVPLVSRSALDRLTETPPPGLR